MKAERCRRDDIDRHDICTCPGCEAYRDQNYKLRVERLAKREFTCTPLARELARLAFVEQG